MKKEPTVNKTVRMPVELVKKVQALADQNRRSFAQQLFVLIESQLPPVDSTLKEPDSQDE